MKNICKYFILITVLIFSITTSKAQLKSSQKNNYKPEISLNTGINVFSINRNSLASSFIAPELKFNVSPKLRISTGIIFTQILANDMNMNIMSPYVLNQLNSFYVEGEYLYSERLSISSFFQTSITNFQNSSQPFDIRNKNLKSANIGFNYKISEGVNVSARFGYTNIPFSPFYLPFNSNNYHGTGFGFY